MLAMWTELISKSAMGKSWSMFNCTLAETLLPKLLRNSSAPEDWWALSMPQSQFLQPILWVKHHLFFFFLDSKKFQWGFCSRLCFETWDRFSPLVVPLQLHGNSSVLFVGISGYLWIFLRTKYRFFCHQTLNWSIFGHKSGHWGADLPV